MNEKPMIRVRIAPSPTGYLHIGTARAALFNYLYARRYNGVFVLRIEDTDLQRSEPMYERDIIEGLKRLGIVWDEGPDAGGAFGPYRQSERLESYEKYLRQLSEMGLLYKCFCTEEELQQERETQVVNKQPPKYSRKCLHLSSEQLQAFEAEQKPYTLRFKVTEMVLTVDDLIRGKVSFDTSLLGDFIIAKDFNAPLYNFAVVIDDYLMEITHVVRGEDHISNTPKQILIQQALGFTIPQFAHLPLILNKDRTKLSKRANKVSLIDYLDDGYLPEALVNFMVLLGWNPGDERELFTLEELSQNFSLDHVHKSGAVFDLDKLDWMNGHYIRHKALDDLTLLIIPYLERAGFIAKQGNAILNEQSMFTVVKTNESLSFEYIKKAVTIERARIKKLSEITETIGYLFTNSVDTTKELLLWKDMTTDDARAGLLLAKEVLESISIDDYTPENLEKKLKEAIAQKELSNGYVLWPLRTALTGLSKSPGPFEVAWVLGKEKTVSRINQAMNMLS